MEDGLEVEETIVQFVNIKKVVGLIHINVQMYIYWLEGPVDIFQSLLERQRNVGVKNSNQFAMFESPVPNLSVFLPVKCE